MSTRITYKLRQNDMYTFFMPNMKSPGVLLLSPALGRVLLVPQKYSCTIMAGSSASVPIVTPEPPLLVRSLVRSGPNLRALLLVPHR
jgi:hypothetical protein